jgi:hypothetical protein
MDFGENAPLMATEWSVEARSGGICVVRVVHSLFTDKDDWDDQLEGTENGWPIFFHVLRLYLSHFRGKTGKSLIAMGISPDPEREAWDKFIGLSGLSGLAADQGFKMQIGGRQLSGVVEWAKEQSPPSLMLRLQEPAPGVGVVSACTHGGAVMLSVSLYLYGDEAQRGVNELEPAWQSWLNEHFPPPALPPES